MFGMSWADTLRIVLMGIFILVCIFLTIVVLMQESKQNGLSGDVMDVNENTDLGSSEYATASQAKKDAAVPVVNATTPASASGIHKGVIISKLTKYDKLRRAMNDVGVTGMTVTQVMG